MPLDVLVWTVFLELVLGELGCAGEGACGEPDWFSWFVGSSDQEFHDSILGLAIPESLCEESESLVRP